MEIIATILGVIVFLPLFLLLKVLVCTCVGTFMAWLITFTPMSTWVIHGAATLGLQLTVSNLPALGSFLGFLNAFIPRSNSGKKPFEDKK